MDPLPTATAEKTVSIEDADDTKHTTTGGIDDVDIMNPVDEGVEPSTSGGTSQEGRLNKTDDQNKIQGSRVIDVEYAEPLRKKAATNITNNERRLLIRNLDGLSHQGSTAIPSEEAIHSGQVIVEGIPEEEFSAEELESFPVAFAFHVETSDPNGISEENAKIATLDYEAEKREEKKFARALAACAKRNEVTTQKPVKRREQSKKDKSGAVHLRGKAEAPSSVEHTVSDELPSGWVIRFVPRSNKANKSGDKYYYSPKENFKFNSLSRVRRFLECLKQSGGDEVKAITMFKGCTTTSSKAPPKSVETVASTHKQTCGIDSEGNKGSNKKTKRARSRDSTTSSKRTRDIDTENKHNKEIIAPSPNRSKRTKSNPVDEGDTSSINTSKATLSVNASEPPTPSKLLPFSHPTADKVKHIAAESAEEFPGWTMRRIPRKASSTFGN
ncbi:predicted protein [Thalassiosira pseudonana CCMP1335]|uniref:MBD domain-containing protein n=1 Tax=Thalassiosira pseudonana TaxID=35128 RepID=B8C6W3_THAPS|nr:predicted protein [Thalassiosira pseudonana CCMP1335]EED90641.1 predicted protein [Thalassiosira pseudonana CCMP1335]